MIMPHIMQRNTDRFALLIGCNEYKNFPLLHCAVNDVTSMEKVLKKPDIGGFNKIIKFARGEPSYKVLAKIEDIVTNSAGRNDTVLVYFSGHGKLRSTG